MISRKAFTRSASAVSVCVERMRESEKEDKPGQEERRQGGLAVVVGLLVVSHAVTDKGSDRGGFTSGDAKIPTTD